MARSAATGRRWVDTVSIVLATAAVAGRFLELHRLLMPAAAPSLAVLRAAPLQQAPAGYGWWSWLDQHFYLESALAWAQGDLSPALHWYPPGYPLLGAAFGWLTPADPFTIPDLLCTVGALWLVAGLGGVLIGPVWGRGAGAWLFVLATAVPKRVMAAWVVPWTTTPLAVCALASLLLTLRFVRRPNPVDASLLALAATAAVAFRPGDAAAVGSVCALAAGSALLLRWPGWRAAGRIAGSAAMGAALPAAGFGGAYLAVDGLRPDGYLIASAAYGFEWRLLPLRWVLLVVNPEPLFPGGQGLAQVFPWIVTGLAGMAACLLARTAGAVRAGHALVAATVIAETVQFLCYRDLHPDYLWQNGVYHYFKWTLPVFALYSALLLRGVLAGPRLSSLLAVAAVPAAAFAWRVDLSLVPPALPLPPDGATLVLPQGLPRVDDVLLARTLPGETALLATAAVLRSDGRVFHGSYDFKLTPWPVTVMVQPVRPLPAQPSTMAFEPGSYTLDPAVAPVLARVAPRWGLPCVFRPERAACRSRFLLPAPVLPLGQAVQFGPDGDGEVYRLAGLAASQPDGDWTDGERASLLLRLPPGEAGPLVLEVTATGFAPTGDPIRVTFYANGEQAGQAAFGRDGSTARARIPDGAIRPDGNLQLDIAVANPRVPTRYGVTSDTRALGIRLTALRAVRAD